jgi:hypothetical protein
MGFDNLLRNMGCWVLLYLRAPVNMYCFYHDLDGSNDFTTNGLLIFEGLLLFSLAYSPLILVHHYLTNIGWFTYLLFVLLSMNVYGIVFIDKIRALTKWQHDSGCWFPEIFLRSGYAKFIVGLFFLMLQISVSVLLILIYWEK